ncbi:N-acetylneuraminate synthase [Thiohalobacter sp. IOR34]|uniref:N-acetylneuraminate synthase n=1 Tax=Thiohalobacter sp. IOR34 TaxID=3057176 RepID=UPI0025B01AD5|nr:N-acetylneuraminate synthase [Thiohalobacter sp. IOR34]WJW74590.1 N-acetylneuraminate synthase [Thiohalobacter sp. IOR34]
MGSDRVYVIAEAGVNHNGDADLALRLIDAAAEAGADAVKFQTFVPETLVSRQAPKADYQRRHTAADESQLAMLRRLALDRPTHERLLEHCRTLGIDFLSSPFDIDSARFLVEDLGLPRLKLGSGELTNGPLLLGCARLGVPLILSTGMSTLDEVDRALSLLAFGIAEAEAEPRGEALREISTEVRHGLLQDRLTLLHCTTEYPCPPGDVNLRAMDTLRQAFGLTVGYSDHTPGIHVAVAAAARDAKLIEKHFTLDRELPGPDHQASLEPNELRAMIDAIRDIEQALGDGHKRPAASEQGNSAIARRSLVASRPIRAGECFGIDNLAAKRPGHGLSPMDYWSLLGQPARRDYAPDEVIDPCERP